MLRPVLGWGRTLRPISVDTVGTPWGSSGVAPDYGAISIANGGRRLRHCLFGSTELNPLVDRENPPSLLAPQGFAFEPAREHEQQDFLEAIRFGGGTPPPKLRRSSIRDMHSQNFCSFLNRVAGGDGWQPDHPGQQLNLQVHSLDLKP